MKKIISLILAVVLITVIGTSAAFADEFSTPSTMTYKAPNTYTVNIPTEIVVGELTEITADNINVANGERVEIYLDGIETSGSVVLQHETDTSSTVDVIVITDGRELTAYENKVGWFSGEDDSATYWGLNSYVDYRGGAPKAGLYSGTVYFTIMSVEA